MNRPRVGVVLINWKKPKEVAKSVGYLQAQNYPKQQIYVVNNDEKEELFGALRSVHEVAYKVIEPQHLSVAGTPQSFGMG